MTLTVFCFIFCVSGSPDEPAITTIDRPVVEFRRTFLDVEGVCAGPGNSYLVSDKLSYRYYETDPEGTRETTVGKRGRKEGEFSGPGPIAAYGSRIAVADFGSPRVQIFDTGLKYLSTITAPGPVFDLHFDDRGRLWIASHSANITGTLYCYDSTGSIVRSITPRHCRGDLFLDVFRFAMLPRGRIALAFMAQNAVEFYDTAGTFHRMTSISCLPEHTEFEFVRRDGRDIPYPTEILLRAISSDKSGNVYLLNGGYPPHPHQEIYVLTPEGRHARTLKIPRPAQGIWTDGRGRLIVSEERKSKLRVYSIPMGR
jgi:hypothetical protein